MSSPCVCVCVSLHKHTYLRELRLWYLLSQCVPSPYKVTGRERLIKHGLFPLKLLTERKERGRGRRSGGGVGGRQEKESGERGRRESSTREEKGT